MIKKYCDCCRKESKELYEEILDVAKLKWGVRREYSAKQVDLCCECYRELGRVKSKVDAYRIKLNNDFLGMKTVKESGIELIDENVELKMRNETLTEELTRARNEIERLNECLSLAIRSEGK